MRLFFYFRAFQVFLTTVLLSMFWPWQAIAAFPPCEGDFNHDGIVDGADLAMFAKNYNHSGCSQDCYGDFYKDGDVDSDDLAIFAEDFGRDDCSCVEYKVHGLNFSPYMDGQSPDWGTVISEDQIRERLRIIAPYTNWIRTFGMTHGLENTGRIAHEMNLKVAAGAWLGRDSAENERQISNLIEAARNGEVDLAIVGSEVLLRHDLTETRLLEYIQQFRDAAPGIPVTTADVYSVLLAHPALIDASDVVFVNYYPYWEGMDVDTAVAHVHSLHQQMLAAAGEKEVIVSETGWPSDGNVIGDAVPSLENACFYNLNVVSWARAEHVKYFVFEAFDEAWKASYEQPQGAHWGMWYSDGVMKACMAPVFEGETLDDNWTCNGPVQGPGQPEIEFTMVPALGSFDDLKGQVLHIVPDEYRVAVYIRVGSGWWTKPYFASPLTDIECDGSWTCDITTGGSDSQANIIAAFLVPADYDPPLAGGISALPAEIFQNAAASVQVSRTP